MLGMSSFNRKPRQYNYTPRYFDPEKEARKERNELLSDTKDDNYVPGKYIQSHRRNRMLGLDRPQSSSLDKNRVLIRLLIFIFLLFLLGYGILKSDIILKILSINS